MSEPEAVYFARLPIVFFCPVPVDGDGETMRNGEMIPLDERNGPCGADAVWTIGAQILCEKHLRLTCELMELDADEIIRELSGATDHDITAKAD